MEENYKQPAAAVVRLPDGNYVLSSWRARDGSSVQKGETIAFARASHATSRNESPAPLAVAAGHKRPKKRKRGVGMSVAAIASTSSGGDSVDGTSTSSSSFKHLLSVAEKSVSKDHSARPTLTASSLIPIVAPMDGLLQINITESKDDPQCIGFINKCNHPAIMDGLCAVCGRPVAAAAGKTNKLASKQNRTESSQRQVTVSGGVTVVVSEEEAQDMARQSCNKLRLQKKLSLVLDLDHTLVHATADPRAKAHAEKYKDVRTLLFPIELGPTPNSNGTNQTVVIQHFLKLRPHVKEFLQRVMPLYEVSIYTAGTRAYADEVIAVLCRHVVGATVDQVQFNQMRHDLWVAKRELAKQQKQQQHEEKMNGTNNDSKAQEETKQAVEERESESNSDKEAPAKAESDTQGDTNKDESTREDDSSKGKAEAASAPEKANPEPKKTRKQVSFGSLPPTVKTDAVTQERVDDLTKQLQEAEAMEAKAIELRQSLFGSRIVSRTDVSDLGRDTKSIKRIFPCGGTMAAIVDDREDVWAKDSELSNRGEPPPNLLLVRPYHWKPFLGFADVNNSSGKYDFVDDENGDAKKGDDSEETDIQLLWSADILERLHKRFYNGAGGERTVPQLLDGMRSEVLAGKRLVLSGLVPLHKQQRQKEGTHPRPTVVRYAESLGGKLMDTIGPDTTHVVAARDGTDKIIMARKIPGCHVVKAMWLTECLWSLTLRSVSNHFLGTPSSSSKAAAVAPPLPPNNTAQFSSDDSSDDDEFAAELEQEMME